MPLFTYRASDATGAVQRGRVEAETARAARAALREQNLWVLELGEADAAGRRGLLAGRRWSPARLADLTRQLAGLLGAGLTLTRALTTMIEQETQPAVRATLGRVRGRVEAGSSLSEALAGEPAAFSPTYRAVVAAGETAGDLPGVAARLADYLETRHTLRLKVMSALAYPAIVCVVALAVVSGLLVYVVPQVVSVFEHTKVQLPLLTRAMLGLSTALRAGWWLWLPLLAGGFWLARDLWRRPTVRARIDRTLLGVPGIGPAWRSVDSARAASTLAMLSTAGVPLLTALDTVGRTLTNSALREALTAATAEVREGVRLSRALARSGRFPPLLVQLIDNGEATGRLSDMLEHAARTQQAEVERRLLLLTSLLEPLLVLAMGLLVLLIVLAVMMPIIEINQLIR
jgi:general secretion pathway protein F